MQKNQSRFHFIVYFIFGFFFLALFTNSIKLTTQYIERRHLVAEQKRDLDQTVIENNRLKYQLKKTGTDAYIEERARQMALTKENEYLVVVAYPTPFPTPTPTPVISVYRQWLTVFFGK